MREVCSQKRYHPPTPAILAKNQSKLASGEMVLIGGRLFKSGDAPYTNGEIASFRYTDDINWTKIFNSSFGKKRAWLLLEEALENYLGSIAGTLHDGTPIDQISFIIDGSKGSETRFYNNNKWKTKKSITTYGEADLKLQVWSERLIGDEHGLLITIDSDSIAIAMLNNIGAVIELSKVWKGEDGSQYYSSISARKNQCSSVYTELVHIIHMNPTNAPLQRIFCVLAAGGCDYSGKFLLTSLCYSGRQQRCLLKLLCINLSIVGGLLGFGIKKEALVFFGRDGFDSDEWFYRDGDDFMVDVGMMITFLCENKVRKSRKNLTVDKFCLEVHRILWTILYWCGCGRSETPAGPPTNLGLEKNWIANYSANATSVETLLSTVESSSQPLCIGTI